MKQASQILAATVATTIAVGSLIPAATGTGPGDTTTLLVSYVLHVVAYAALAASLFFIAECNNQYYWHVIGIAAVYGAGMELLQIPVPGRAFSLVDIAVNTLGASLITIDMYFPFLSHLYRAGVTLHR